ncbi:Golgi SNAP receptor complex member 1-2 [Diplonema papillatum]|nr:Golgi SNAP receptor complex member 1-2 [Diplonema papillatum]
METATKGMWERKKLEVRRLESEVESHLIQLEGLEVGADSEQVAAVHNETRRLIGSLRGSTRTLSEWAEAASGAEGMSLRQFANRFEATVIEKERSLRQIMDSLESKRARQQLLRDVHHDIDEYTEHHGLRALGEEADTIAKARMETERMREQAIWGHTNLKNQHSTFLRAQDRVARIVSAIPGIDSVLSKIRSKRQRNTIVIAITVAVCLFLVVIFM